MNSIHLSIAKSDTKVKAHETPNPPLRASPGAVAAASRKTPKFVGAGPRASDVPSGELKSREAFYTASQGMFARSPVFLAATYRTGEQAKNARASAARGMQEKSDVEPDNSDTKGFFNTPAGTRKVFQPMFFA